MWHDLAASMSVHRHHRPTHGSPRPHVSPSADPALADSQRHNRAPSRWNTLFAAITTTNLNETRADLASTNEELDAMAMLQSAQSESIRCLSDRATTLEQKTDAIDATADKLSARVAAPEARPTTPASSSPPCSTNSANVGPSDPYSVDRTIVTLGTNTTVSLEAVRLAIAPLVERAGLRLADVDVRGPTLGQRFVLKRATKSTTDERQTVDPHDDDQTAGGIRWTSSHPAAPRFQLSSTGTPASRRGASGGR